MEEKPTLDELPGAEGLDDEPGSAAASRGLIPDAVRKAILAGVGALFMTEEGARRLAREWKLPKEVIGFIGQQASSAKEEMLRMLADEIRHFLESEAVRRELGRVLESMAIEVNAEIRLRRADDESSRPEVKAEVRARKRTRRRR